MADATITFGHPDDSRLDPDRLVGFLARLDAAAGRALRRNLDDRDDFQDRLYRDYGRGLDGMDLLYFSALEAADWAKNVVHAQDEEDEQEECEEYYAVIRGLTARAISAYAEVAWLLRGGFPHGSLTRVRFLHELFVTAGVLAEYGSPGGSHPELIERYLEHRDVFTPAIADDLVATGALDSTEYFEKDVLDALERRRAELLTRYGKSFAAMWGWAAPLFPGESRVTMRMMGSLVAPEGHYFYGMTSAHVHAGSEGWHETVVIREHETSLASGATNLGLALPSALATAFLLEIIQMAVPSRVERDDMVEETGAYFLVALARMSGSISDHMWRGEETVEQAEISFQERVRQGVAEERPPAPLVRGLALRATHRLERTLRRTL